MSRARAGFVYQISSVNNAWTFQVDLPLVALRFVQPTLEPRPIIGLRRTETAMHRREMTRRLVPQVGGRIRGGIS
jgi:hypothetical protein